MSKTGFFRALMLTVLITGALATPAWAVPELQLDILGGNYIGGLHQTTVATGSGFRLYAYLGGSGLTAADLAKTYYVTAAIVPQQNMPAVLGTFDFGGSTYNVTADMTFGTPPMEIVSPGHDPGDMVSHGFPLPFFPTYYKQFAFTFSSAVFAQEVDVASIANPHTGPQAWTSGNKMYYVSFEVNDANLLPHPGWERTLHFDLFSTKTGNGGVTDPTDIDLFAAVTKDAQSCGEECQVPEPTSVLLVGFGLAGLSALGFRRRR